MGTATFLTLGPIAAFALRLGLGVEVILVRSVCSLCCGLQGLDVVGISGKDLLTTFSVENPVTNLSKTGSIILPLASLPREFRMISTNESYDDGSL